jgi:hypothetical protein
VSNGALFVSFAESDGGHSYLAARAMLEPSQVGHLVFRNTVSETLDALVAGQSNFAVVPFYNSITQWEGATVKALATGQFEIFAQTCMPTSYVLAAHREHINIALQLYAAERNIQPENLPDFTQLDDWLKRKFDKFAADNPQSSPEERKKYEERELEAAKDALKTYTRLLTTIYVGAQADEQYRGRLVRPDMNRVDIDLTRNPLRVLEEVNRSDLMKSMARSQGPQPQPVYPQNISGGSIPLNFGFGAPPLLKDFKGPAALVAKGLMEAPGSQEGWDKPGSLGEIVALLRKLLVLLDVYSFGPPDLPDNKTQYLLLARKGEKIRPDFKSIAGAHDAPLRTMALIRANPKVHGRDVWLGPREELRRRTEKPLGVVYDRPPLMVSPAGRTVFLQEGGKLKSMLGGHGDIKELAEKLKKAVERKPSESGWGNSASKLDASFLGVYPTWSADKICDGWLCEPAGPHKPDSPPSPFLIWLGKNWPLLLLLLLLLLGIAYSIHTWRVACEDSDSAWCTGHVDWQKVFPPPPPPSSEPPVAPPSEPPPPSTNGPQTSGPAPLPYPTSPPPPVHVTPPVTHVPPPPVAGPPPYIPPPEPVFHVPFFEAKANLLPESLTALRDAAMRALETDKLVRLRIFALGPRETDGELWRRRLQAVKDELVRLGVPADRILQEGEGPYEVVIRQRVVPSTRTGRQRVTMEVIPDPLAGDDDQ